MCTRQYMLNGINGLVSGYGLGLPYAGLPKGCGALLTVNSPESLRKSLTDQGYFKPGEFFRDDP